MKVCSKCQTEKPFEEFSKCGAGKRRRTVCKACQVIAERARKVQSDPEKWRASRRAATIKHKYGITMEQFDLMVDLQQGLCPICKQALVEPNVDHCHKTGKVRAILCRKCNTGIGMMDDNIETLESAIEYLRRHGDG